MLVPELRRALSYPEQLRSIGDLCFNLAVKELGVWMKTNAPHVTDELRQSTRYMHQWRSHKKLARVAFDLMSAELGVERIQELWTGWRKERKAAGQDLFASRVTVERWAARHGVEEPRQQLSVYLEWWRRKNRHLYGWERHQMNNAMLTRREIYRLWARSVCDRYREIRIENFDLRKVAIRPPKGTELTQQEKRARHHRFLASPSTLRIALLSASSAGQIRKLSAVDNTRRCKFCGVVSKIDAKKSVETVCPVCHNEPIAGAGDDQDFRNADNQLIREDWADQEEAT